MTLYGQLQQITTQLLTSDDRATLAQAIGDMRGLFVAVTGLEQVSTATAPEFETTRLNGGVAICPNFAAVCLQDVQRTTQFLRGVHAAIEAARRRFANGPIHILYAGCGPYATLLLPLTTQFSAETLQLTCLDIHALSLACVEKLVAALGVEAHIAGYVQADAITYRHPADTPLHIVVSETMQAALVQEPQVAILRNLVPQLSPEGFVVPQEIVVTAHLADASVEDREALVMPTNDGVAHGWQNAVVERRTDVGHVMTLNRETAPTLRGGHVHLGTLTVPPHATRHMHFLLQTTVTVFGEFSLGPYACTLTHPRRVPWLDEVLAGTQLDFTYQIGYHAGIEIQASAMAAPEWIVPMNLPTHIAP